MPEFSLQDRWRIDHEMGWWGAAYFGEVDVALVQTSEGFLTAVVGTQVCFLCLALLASVSLSFCRCLSLSLLSLSSSLFSRLAPC